MANLPVAVYEAPLRIGYSVHCASVKGARDYMEDRYAIVEHPHELFGIETGDGTAEGEGPPPTGNDKHFGVICITKLFDSNNFQHFLLLFCFVLFFANNVNINYEKSFSVFSMVTLVLVPLNMQPLIYWPTFCKANLIEQIQVLLCEKLSLKQIEPSTLLLNNMILMMGNIFFIFAVELES